MSAFFVLIALALVFNFLDGFNDSSNIVATGHFVAGDATASCLVLWWQWRNFAGRLFLGLLWRARLVKV